MNAPSAMIAEDEPLLRTEIRDALQTLWPQLRIAAEVGDGVEAIRALDQLTPDVLFLDIQMPGASGIDVARSFSSRRSTPMRCRHSNKARSTTSSSR